MFFWKIIYNSPPHQNRHTNCMVSSTLTCPYRKFQGGCCTTGSHQYFHQILPSGCLLHRFPSWRLYKWGSQGGGVHKVTETDARESWRTRNWFQGWRDCPRSITKSSPYPCRSQPIGIPSSTRWPYSSVLLFWRIEALLSLLHHPVQQLQPCGRVFPMSPILYQRLSR